MTELALELPLVLGFTCAGVRAVHHLHASCVMRSLHVHKLVSSRHLSCLRWHAPIWYQQLTQARSLRSVFIAGPGLQWHAPSLCPHAFSPLFCSTVMSLPLVAPLVAYSLSANQVNLHLALPMRRDCAPFCEQEYRSVVYTGILSAAGQCIQCMHV